MRSRILFLLKYYLFWILVSVFAKVIFFIYQGRDGVTVSEYIRIIYKGLPMDVSLGGYILLLSTVVMAFSPYVKDWIIRRMFSCLSGGLVLLFWLIATSDWELFQNWGYHIDATVLGYMRTPKEALASISNGLIVLLVVLWLLLAVFSYGVYAKYIGKQLVYTTGKYWLSLVFLAIGGVLIIPIRGGLNVAPMNSSFVFFHKTNMYVNQSAINPVWNFMYEVTHANRLNGNYQFMDNAEAHMAVDKLYHTGDTMLRLLKTPRPDVVVLLLESFTADAIGVLGGNEEATPQLNQLAREGVLFSNIYATGNRSDRGMAGVVSAYPSYPNYPLLKYPTKMERHPRFPKDMEKEGYHTCFYYAGDVNFAGFRALATMSFQDMVTESDFSGEAKKTTFKWGMHDEFMFERLFKDMTQASHPFMFMAFNMSSHEPFDVPMETKIAGESKDKRFLNAIYYSDRCIGEFIRQVKEAGMWDNLLLVLVADHGTIAIKKHLYYEPETFHIPLIFAGGALNVRDTVISTIGSQTDVVATLLAQLDISHSQYRFSKNLLAKDAVPFAYYSTANAGAVVTDNGVTVMDLKSRKIIMGDTSGNNEYLLKAYLQVLDEDIQK
ncbi:LTA synthase family protein [Odoribacter lunatus]|uniref:LTA synthase family protein n=1 Tax=Odoribacter lunatus TaxID=2941335 RepID=UPI00203A955C|nr:LTA synthase family protein [Odoribacter lunatus]